MGSKRMAVMLENQKLFYKARENMSGCFDEHKEIIVDGESFEKINRGKYSWRLSSIPDLDNFFSRMIFYRGEFYKMYGYDYPNTIEEVSELHTDLEKHWRDVVWCRVNDDTLHEDNMDGVFYMWLGHSTAIKRKITLSELKTPYKEIKKRAESSSFDSSCIDEFLRRWRIAASSFLMISQDKYVLGKYSLNEQILKRLHAKINYKSKHTNT
jgi:hypothetical protein